MNPTQDAPVEPITLGERSHLEWIVPGRFDVRGTVRRLRILLGRMKAPVDTTSLRAFLGTGPLPKTKINDRAVAHVRLSQESATEASNRIFA